ncbi:transposase, partial [Enterococcus faecium]|nr:transposase [Enterococcus faecium]
KKYPHPLFFVKNYCTIQVAYGYRNFHNFRARTYLIQGLIFQVKQKPVKHSA